MRQIGHSPLFGFSSSIFSFLTFVWCRDIIRGKKDVVQCTFYANSSYQNSKSSNAIGQEFFAGTSRACCFATSEYSLFLHLLTYMHLFG